MTTTTADLPGPTVAVFGGVHDDEVIIFSRPKHPIGAELYVVGRE